MKNILLLSIALAGLALGQGGAPNKNGVGVNPVPFKTQLGLENVDNTADLDKPISTLQAAADAAAQADAQAFSIQRANHTGTQAQATIDNLTTDLAARSLIADIRNNLTSVDADKPLSAAQGKALKDLVDAINAVLASDETTLDTLQEVVDFIQVNRADIDALNIAAISGLQAALDAKETPFGAQTKADAAQAAAIQRVNHTGTQAQSTVDDLVADLAAKAPLTNAELITPTINGNTPMTLEDNQTVSGDIDHTGAVTIADQDTSIATSAVNVGMVNDLFMADHTSREWSIFGMANTNVGWGSYATYLPSEAKIFVASAVTGSSCHVRANPNAAGMPFVAGGDQNSIDWSKRIRISFMCYFAYSDADTVTRFQVGEDYTKTTISDLDQKGFGFKKTNTSISVLAHNGTTLTTLAAGTVTDGTHLILMESDGAGNVKLYIDGTLVQTATGGATTLGSFGKSAVNFSVDNGAGTGIPHFDLYGTIKVKIGN